MNRGQQNKLFLGISSMIVLCCAIIGVFRYSASPQDKKKDKTTNPTPPMLPRGDKDTTSPSTLPLSDREHSTIAPSLHALLSARLGVVHVNNMYNAALLGLLGGLFLAPAAHLQKNNQNALRPFPLPRPHHILVLMAEMALVGYIGCFFYQHYSIPKVPTYHLAKDIGLFALVSIATHMGFYLELFKWLSSAAFTKPSQPGYPLSGRKHIVAWLMPTNFIGKLIGSAISFIAYWLAINTIIYFKSNDKIKATPFRRNRSDTWTLAMHMLAHTWNIAKDNPKRSIYTKLLWTIPIYFTYVQAFWEPVIPITHHKKIAAILAWLFQTSHLHRALHDMYKVYLLGEDGYKTIKKSLIWELCLLAWAGFKWGFLYHVAIKKASPTAPYTLSFPLGIRALLEGAMMVLAGVYAPLEIYFSRIFTTRSEKILSIATLLIGALCIKHYIREAKSPTAQWVDLLRYLLLRISGTIVAVAYLRRNAHSGNINQILLGTGSLLLCGLYIFPKCVHRIATTYLALTKGPPYLRKIVRGGQSLAVAWLQPRLDVVFTAIVTCTMSIMYRHTKRAAPPFEIVKEALTIYALALGAYLMLKILAYLCAMQKQLTGALAQHIIVFSAFYATIHKTSQIPDIVTKNNLQLGYIAVAIGVQSLLSIIGDKRYQNRLFPSFTQVKKLLETIYTHLSQLCFHGLLLLRSFVFPHNISNPLLGGTLNYTLFGLFRTTMAA